MEYHDELIQALMDDTYVIFLDYDWDAKGRYWSFQSQANCQERG